MMFSKKGLFLRIRTRSWMNWAVFFLVMYTIYFFAKEAGYNVIAGIAKWIMIIPLAFIGLFIILTLLAVILVFFGLISSANKSTRTKAKRKNPQNKKIQLEKKKSKKIIDVDYKIKE